MSASIASRAGVSGASWLGWIVGFVYSAGRITWSPSHALYTPNHNLHLDTQRTGCGPICGNLVFGVASNFPQQHNVRTVPELTHSLIVYPYPGTVGRRDASPVFH